MLKCLLVVCAALLIVADNANGNEFSVMGKKSNRVNLLSRAVGARMLAGTAAPSTIDSMSTSSATGSFDASGNQFVPIPRQSPPAIASPSAAAPNMATFDVSKLTPDQIAQLQMFMSNQHTSAPSAAAPVAAPAPSPVMVNQPEQKVQPTMQDTLSQQIAQLQMQLAQQQQQQVPVTTPPPARSMVNNNNVDPVAMQRLADQIKAMQNMQGQQKMFDVNQLSQQLSQFETLQRQTGGVPQQVQPAKVNEQPQRVTFDSMGRGFSSNTGSSGSNPVSTGISGITQSLGGLTQGMIGATTGTLGGLLNGFSLNGLVNNLTNPVQTAIQTGVNTFSQVGSLGQNTLNQLTQPITQTKQAFPSTPTATFNQVQTVPSVVQPPSTPITTGGGAVNENICAQAQPGELFAHPSDPTQFVICYGFGEFTVMDCPDMLVYNDHLKRCDVNTDMPLLCKSNPCMNNGKCVETGPVAFKCECNSGFGGQFCEKLDTCSTKPCGTDGVCIPFVLGSPVAHVCLCNGGRTVGVSCQKTEPNPCMTPGSNLRLLPVTFNPSVFAHCEGSRPHFKFCQPPLLFSSTKQVCEWA
jgi:hypothetical protein